MVSKEDVRETLVVLEGALRLYEWFVDRLLDSVRQCPDRFWVQEILEARILRHNNSGHKLEQALAQLQEAKAS